MEVCEFLVAANANVNAKDKGYDGHSWNRIRKCRRALGFVLNVFNTLLFCSLWTPLYWSSGAGHVEVCQFLVASNADVNVKDKRYDRHPYTRI